MVEQITKPNFEHLVQNLFHQIYKYFGFSLALKISAPDLISSLIVDVGNKVQTQKGITIVKAVTIMFTEAIISIGPIFLTTVTYLVSKTHIQS